jgi:hypothetical protein
MNSPLFFVPAQSFAFMQAGTGSFSSFLVVLYGAEDVSTNNPAAAISMAMPVNMRFLVFMSAGF